MTHTDLPPARANVLHISFDRSVTFGAAEEVLRKNGARVVESPDSTGIIGIAPSNLASGKATPERMSEEMSALATRLRADPRVRWIEPVPTDNAPTPRGP
jgi:hypothetical protein